LSTGNPGRKQARECGQRKPGHGVVSPHSLDPEWLEPVRNKIRLDIFQAC
jgi:hypothetical protein